MGHELRLERRRVRWFFAGLLVVSALIEIVGALLVQHETRAEILSALLPSAVMLGGRTGAVLSGLALLLLAGGIARGKRVAFRLTLLVLLGTIAFELVKDLDFEAASLFAWILFGLFWFRHHFDADSDPARMRWGFFVLGFGVLAAVIYTVVGAAILQNELQPEFGFMRSLESLGLALAGSPRRYQALTERADWFLTTLPIVSYALVILALTQLLRPVLAPWAGETDRGRVRDSLRTWGRNYVSRLAVHGATSYHWFDSTSCVAFTLRGRTALALGDPICPPESSRNAITEFMRYCDGQDWIPAFYQVDEPALYRELGMTLVPVGAEAVVQTAGFGLDGKTRADLRYAVRRCEREAVRFEFLTGPEALAAHAEQLRAVSGRWLKTRRSPELQYSLGTLASLGDPDIVVGLAFAADGQLDAFVSWLPVPARRAWTLDLMRRRPQSAYGVVEAMIVRSIDEAQSRGIQALSLGVAPRVLTSPDRAWRAVYWGLDRFQRSKTLRRFKEKFGPTWEQRYLAVPTSSALPEVLVAVARAHVPTLSALVRSVAAWTPRRAREIAFRVRPQRPRRAVPS